MPKKKKTPVEKVDLSVKDEFDITIDLINKERGDKILRSLNDERPEFDGGLSSGSLSLDWCINAEAGGMKWGQLLQLYGEKSAGKSTLALGFCANCTNLGKRVIYMDLEGTMDPKMVKKAGVNPELFHFLDDDGREAAMIAERLMRAGDVGLFVIDSLAAWEPEVVPKKNSSSSDDDLIDFTQPKMAYQGSFITQVIKKLCRTARETGAIIISINQVRNNLALYSGNPSIIPYGPKALEHAVSVQCLVKGKPRGAKNVITDAEGELIGQFVTVVADKNKTAIPMREVQVPLILGTGINPYMELATLAQLHGIVAGRAGNFKWVESGETICKGINNFTQMLSEDEELYDNLRQQVIEALGLNYTDMPVNAYDNPFISEVEEE